MLQQRVHGKERRRTEAKGLFAVTWSWCQVTRRRRPVLVVIDQYDGATAVVSEVDLADSGGAPGLFDPCVIERDEEALHPVFYAAGCRPDDVAVLRAEGAEWLVAMGKLCYFGQGSSHASALHVKS
jgi:hypothetical protein